jgi:hypothetical protein
VVDRIGREEFVSAVGLEELFEHLGMRGLVDDDLAGGVD